MNTALTIAMSVFATLVVVGAVLAALYHCGKREYQRQQAVHVAQLNRLRVHRAEFDAEQKIRSATQSAMMQMLAEVRSAANAGTSANSGDFGNSTGPSHPGGSSYGPDGSTHNTGP